MGLQLSNKKVEHRIEMDGSVILYHEVPYVDRQRLVMKFVTNGSFDPFEVSIALLKLMIFGWENVRGDDGEEVEFDPELIQCLSGDALLELIDKIVSVSLKGIIQLKDKLVKDNQELTKSESGEDDSKNS